MPGNWTTAADLLYHRPMIKILTWLIWVWCAAAVLLNFVGSVGMVLVPSWLDAMERITNIHPLFNAAYFIVELVLILMAVGAIVWQEKLTERADMTKRYLIDSELHAIHYVLPPEPAKNTL